MLAVFLQTPASLCDLQIVVWSLCSLIFTFGAMGPKNWHFQEVCICEVFISQELSYCA